MEQVRLLIAVPSWRRLAGILLLVGVFGLVSATTYLIIGGISFTNDWTYFFRPAALLMLQGGNPYETGGVFTPWALIPLIPFAMLPPALGAIFIAEIYVIIFLFVSKRLGASRWAAVAVALSPFVLWGAIMGNIDWLVALGLVMPPQWGLLFVMVKPQAGIAIAVFWFVEAWRRGGWKECAHLVAPLTVVILLSFAAYGFWPRYMIQAVDYSFNWSLWPWSIPLGLFLLGRAILKRRLGPAIAAGPFLSPYVSQTTWAIPLLGLSKK